MASGSFRSRNDHKRDPIPQIARNNQPMANDKLDDSGLRYRSKSPGSQYSAEASRGNTMSCFKCGRHKARKECSTVRMLGANQFVCGDCRPPAASASPKG